MISIEKVVRRSLLHVFCSLLGVHGLLMVGPTDCKDNQGGEHVLGGQVSVGEFRVNSAWFMDLLHDFFGCWFQLFCSFSRFLWELYPFQLYTSTSYERVGNSGNVGQC